MTRGHDITIEQGTEHVRVVKDGQVLAESRRPLVLRETGCPPRYYLPRQDVRTDLLTPSDTTTHCPFKGDARYWSVPGATDLVWRTPSRTLPRSRTTSASTTPRSSDRPAVACSSPGADATPTE